MFKLLLCGKNITHNDSMCPTIVTTGYCPKSFLPGSVPLQEQIKT